MGREAEQGGLASKGVEKPEERHWLEVTGTELEDGEAGNGKNIRSKRHGTEGVMASAW